MRQLMHVVGTLACLVMLPTPVWAQGGTFGGGSITGVVKDTSGGVLPGVTVEASSPALIEGVRSVVTDERGQYRIVDLRPGTYMVRFTLTGFSRYQREGLELAGQATLTINAELKVGAIEETITVTGETPIVDVQSTLKQTVLSADIIAALPTGREFNNLGVLIPGVNSTVRDVGGVTGSPMNNISMHGSTGGDALVMLNGLSLGALQATASPIAGRTTNPAASQEVVIDTAGASAERANGGPAMNYIPRDGGNTFRGSVFLTGASEGQQASNFTQDLKDEGLQIVNKFKKNWDFNPGFGGPILKDKLWFYVSGRDNAAQIYTNMFYNQNEFLPNVWNYQANLDRPGLGTREHWREHLVRLTWQASPNHKFASMWEQNYKCGCPGQAGSISPTLSPEAGGEWRFPVMRQLNAEWWSPITGKLLVEAVAMHLTERWGVTELRPTQGAGYGGSIPSMDVATLNALYPTLIGVTQTNPGGGISTAGVRFHGPFGTFNNNWTPDFTYRVAVSYITGAHAFKVGIQDLIGTVEQTNYLNTRDAYGRPVRYTFTNAFTGPGTGPQANQGASVTAYMVPFFFKNDQDHDLGIYVQDRWTRDRYTLNLGLRYDWYKSSWPEQSVPASTIGFSQNRPAMTFPGGDSLSFKDVSPRFGVSYDLMGDGKTAVKASLNRYVAIIRPGNQTGNPLRGGGGISQNITRTWTDTNGNFIADCDVFGVDRNGECTAASEAAWDTATANALNTTSNQLTDLETRFGWGKRSYNWEFSAGVQREIMPRVSVDVSYFRRWFGNFTATDNTACVDTVNQLGCVVPGNYKSYDITAPVDSRLPGGGAYTLTGFIDPDCTGPQASCGTTTAAQIAALTARNQTRFADDIGANRIQHWNGVDVNVTARLQNGLLLQGGTSTGRQSTDQCEVWALLPEEQGNTTSREACKTTEPFRTQVKALASYRLPRYTALPVTLGRVIEDMQVAATFQSIPGNQKSATYQMPAGTGASSEVAIMCPRAGADPSCSTLGRAVSGATATTTRNINLILPNTVFDERQNQLDLRIGRLVRIGRTRASVNFDIFNVFNQNTVLNRSNALSKSTTPGAFPANNGVQQADGKYHTLWAPTSILQARFFKISVQFDF